MINVVLHVHTPCMANLLQCLGSHLYFSAIFTDRENFLDFLFVLLGLLLKGENLMLGEPALSFESWLILREWGGQELHLQKVYIHLP